MTYESPADLANEARIAEAFRVAMGFVSMVKPGHDPLKPYACVVDRYFSDDNGEVAACCEIKCRNTVPFRKYPTLNIDKIKCWTLRNDERKGIPAYLIIEWADALGWTRPGLWDWNGDSPDGINGGLWGNPNRPNSMRQCFYIPRRAFSMLTEAI